MALQSKLRNLIIDGDYESLKMFLDTFKNVDLNYVYPNGILTILSIALVYYNEECIKLLVDRGMNVDLPYNIELGEQKNSINGIHTDFIYNLIKHKNCFSNFTPSFYMHF